MIVPSPEKRLCPKHGRPIRPSQWIAGNRGQGCAKCTNVWGRIRRRARWDSGERPICKNHPLTIVAKADWITCGRQLCASCNDPKLGTARYFRKLERNKQWRLDNLEQYRFAQKRRYRKQKLRSQGSYD